MHFEMVYRQYSKHYVTVLRHGKRYVALVEHTIVHIHTQGHTYINIYIYSVEWLTVPQGRRCVA